MILSWTSLRDFPPFLFPCRRLFSPMEWDIKDSAEQEAKKRSIPGHLASPSCCPMAGKPRAPQGLSWNSQKARRPAAVPFWVTQKPGKPHKHPVSCSAAEQSRAQARDKDGLWQHQSRDQIPRLSTSTSLRLHLSPLDSQLASWIILIPRPVGRPKE